MLATSDAPPAAPDQASQALLAGTDGTRQGLDPIDGQPSLISRATVPTIGWTPRDRVRRWGFSVGSYGPQQQTECTATGGAPWCNPDAGNGLAPDGTPIAFNDPTDTSRAVGPDFVTRWMAHVAGRTGTASRGTMKLRAPRAPGRYVLFVSANGRGARATVVVRPRP